MAGFLRIHTHGVSQASHLYETRTIPILQGMTALTAKAAAVLIFRIGVSKGRQHTQTLLPQFPLFLPVCGLQLFPNVP